MSLAKPLTLDGVEIDVVKPAVADQDEEEELEPIWRTISYDAFAPVQEGPSQPVEVLPHAAAYKVSAVKRSAQVAFAVLVCSLASGIVFGYAALKPILIAEGVYQDLCPPGNEPGFSDLGEDVNLPGAPCAAQDTKLNSIFISGSIALNVSTVLAGAVSDRFGRRVCWIVSSVLLAAGCLLMGLAFRIPEFDGYIAGYILLGLGGTFVFVSSFELANAFPRRSGIIVALVTGAFDASAALFFLFRLAYDASGGRLAPSHFFFGFLVVPVLILTGELLLMPARTYHTPRELEKKIKKAQDTTRDWHESDEEITNRNELRRVRDARAESRMAKLDQIEQVAGDADERQERRKLVEEHQVASGVWGVLHGLPAHRQMLTPWFVLMLLLTVLQMLRMNYFIATVRAQYRYMLGSEHAAEVINDFFDAALPIAGALSTPFIGLLLDHASSATILAILSLFIIAIGVFNCLSFLWAGYITVVAFVLFRPLYYSAMSDYATKVFGFATFGRIYGSLICISGLVNLVQPALDVLTHGPLHGDPLPINAFMGAMGAVLSVALTVFVASQTRAFWKQQLQMEADHERERLIPEEDEEYGTMG